LILNNFKNKLFGKQGKCSCSGGTSVLDKIIGGVQDAKL